MIRRSVTIAERSADAALRNRMLQGLELQQDRVDIDGITTSVLEGGRGSSIVLLHGGIECGGVYWAPVVSRLAEHHRLVIPDVPGLGESAPAARLDQSTFDSWFAALLRLKCPDPPVVVAHSLLGSLEARSASRPEGRLQRLIIYAAPGVGRYRMPLGLRVAAVRFGMRPSARNAERFDRFALFDFDATRHRDPAWFAAFSAYTISRAKVHHVKATMRHLVASGTAQLPDADLQTIGVPTVLVWGRHDRMVPLAIAESAATRTGWPMSVIDNAGHVPHIEQPDAFVAALRSAMQSPPIDRSNL